LTSLGFSLSKSSFSFSGIYSKNASLPFLGFIVLTVMFWEFLMVYLSYFGLSFGLFEVICGNSYSLGSSEESSGEGTQGRYLAKNT
jgi:hypothetical protein